MGHRSGLRRREGPALLLALLLAPALGGKALAWGVSGHAIVAEIAQRHLSPRAAEKVRELLGGNASLASIAGWADDIALLRPETFNLHFVNIPYAATRYDPARDCRASPKGDCVVAAVERYETALADAALPLAQRREALKFLVHFVADAHQPLHCIDRDGDGGGNRTPVTFFGVATTLHMVWDVSIIERRSYDWGAQVAALETWIAGQNAKTLGAGTAAEWAMESHRAAVDVAYAVPADGVLGEDYYRRARPVVERRLALAGIRLARLLNTSLEK